MTLYNMFIIVGEAIAKTIINNWSSSASEVNGKIPKNAGDTTMHIMQSENIVINKNEVIALNGLHKR